MFNELQFIDEYDSFGLPLFIMYRREANMPISLRLEIIFVALSGSLPGKNPGIYYIRTPFLIYDFATAPLRISLYMRKI